MYSVESSKYGKTKKIRSKDNQYISFVYKGYGVDYYRLHVMDAKTSQIIIFLPFKSTEEGVTASMEIMETLSNTKVEDIPNLIESYKNLRNLKITINNWELK